MEVDNYAVEQKAAATPEEYVFSGSYFHIHEIFDVEDCKTRPSYLKKSVHHRKGKGVVDEGILERLAHLRLLSKMKPKPLTTMTVY